MVEAGANQVPEEQAARGARPRAAGDREALRGAGASSASKAGKPKWLDAGVTAEINDQFGEEIVDHLRQHGLREGAAIVGEILEREAGRLSMESTESDIVRELQVRMSLAQVLEKQRSDGRRGPGPRAVRERPARR